jgi:hypothetical protein
MISLGLWFGNVNGFVLKGLLILPFPEKTRWLIKEMKMKMKRVSEENGGLPTTYPPQPLSLCLFLVYIHSVVVSALDLPIFNQWKSAEEIGGRVLQSVTRGGGMQDNL